MALRIRLTRFGKKHEPSFRIVVKESRSPRDGEYLEQVGFYNPKADPERVELNEERIAHWLKAGATPSETVERLIRKHSSILRDDGRAIGTKPQPVTGATSANVADSGDETSRETIVQEDT